MIPELMVLRVAAPPSPDAKAISLADPTSEPAFGDLVDDIVAKEEPPPVIDVGPRHLLPDWPVDPTGLTAAPVDLVPALVAVAGPLVAKDDAALVIPDAYDPPEAMGKGATRPDFGLPPPVLPDVTRSAAAAHVPAPGHGNAGAVEPLPVRAVAEAAVSFGTTRAYGPSKQGQPVDPANAKLQAPGSRERPIPASPDAVEGKVTGGETPPSASAVLSRAIAAGSGVTPATAPVGGFAQGATPLSEDVLRQHDAFSERSVQADRAVPPRPVPDGDGRNRILPDRPIPDADPVLQTTAVTGKAGTLPKAGPPDDPSAPAKPVSAPAAVVLPLLQAPAQVTMVPQRQPQPQPQPPAKGAVQADAVPATGGVPRKSDPSATSGPAPDTSTGTKDAVAHLPDRTAGALPEAPAFAPSDPALPLRNDPRPVEARHPAQPMPPTVVPMLVDAARALPDAPVTLTLTPEDLGALRFEMQSRGDTIHVSLTVERPETLDMLRRHVEQLTGEFRQAGFANASFSFAGGWGGGGQERAAGAGYATRTVDKDESPVARASKHVNGGLDLRL